MRFLVTALRILASLAAVTIFGLASYWTLRLGYADWLFHTGSLDGAERAVRLAPANARYQAGWALLVDPAAKDSRASRAALEAAVASNPSDSSSWIELGLRAERDGSFDLAERRLLQAARVDKQYDPRWELANFYFRRKDASNFWLWAREAAGMLHGDPAPLLKLCWMMSPDAAVILNRAVPDRQAILAGYLNFLLAGRHWDGVEPVAQRVVEHAGADDLPALFASCDRLTEAGRPSEALRIWNALCRRRLIPYREVEPEKRASLTNGDFHERPVSHGFDWRIDPPEGVSCLWSGGLRITFSGKQPERCEILSQLVPLVPGRQYSLRFDYSASDIAAQAGLRWRIFDAATNAELAAWAPNLSNEKQTQEDLRFSTPDETHLARIVLMYQRAWGTTRIEGSVFLRHAGLAFAARHPKPLRP